MINNDKEKEKKQEKNSSKELKQELEISLYWLFSSYNRCVKKCLTKLYQLLCPTAFMQHFTQMVQKKLPACFLCTCSSFCNSTNTSQCFRCFCSLIVIFSKAGVSIHSLRGQIQPMAQFHIRSSTCLAYWKQLQKDSKRPQRHRTPTEIRKTALLLCTRGGGLLCAGAQGLIVS